MRESVAIVLGAAAVHAASAAAGLVTAVEGATIVDVAHAGHETADIPDSIILIRDGRIAAVGNRRKVPVPRGAHVIRAFGRFVVPGLIDGYGAMRSQAFADAYLYEGVTTVFVLLAPPGGNLDGESAPKTIRNGPSVLTIAPISGYSETGNIPAIHPLTDHRLHGDRLDRSEIATLVDRAAQAGHSGVMAEADVWPDQLDALVAAARQRGLAVLAQPAFTSYPYAVHAGVDAFVRNDHYSVALSRPQDYLAYADDPFGAGGLAARRKVCDGENLEPEISDFGAQLAENSTALMPILTMEATADDLQGTNPWNSRSAAFFKPSDLDNPVDPKTGVRPYLASHADRAEAIRACARRKEAIDRDLHARGAVYLAGSSAPAYGVMPGGGLHDELQLLQQIGLTSREALAAATSNYADAFRLTDRGRIEVGRRADLLILTADPRQDTAALEAIDRVMLEGRLVDRKLLRRAGHTAF